MKLLAAWCYVMENADVIKTEKLSLMEKCKHVIDTKNNCVANVWMKFTQEYVEGIEVFDLILF